MKVFLPLDEDHLPPPGAGERLVPWQVGYLVLAQLSDGTETWEWREPAPDEGTERTQGSNSRVNRSPRSTPSDAAIPALSSST